LALHTRAVQQVFTGDLTEAASLVEEAQSLADMIRGESRLVPYGEVGLAAVRGHEAVAEPMIQGWLDVVVARGEGVGVNMLQWARAVLRNGLGRYREARAAAQEACLDPRELGPPKWALAELVEAGARAGTTRVAAAALDELSAMAQASGTDWALGIEAGRRALLRRGGTAEDLYREALERLRRTTMRLDLARAQLLYGEWLRRQGRRVEARTQLRTACEALTAMGADAFADRARRELLATGETLRKRAAAPSTELTAREAHIARLAAGGFTNSEISARLYISARTVEWHLRSVFRKLGITTRRQLRQSVTGTASTTG
jgi:DNA-binding CsgD family transcriptional regulator